MDKSIPTLSEAIDHISHHKVSSSELIQECFKRIDRLNGRLNCFITVLEEQALAQARVKNGRNRNDGLLAGIPLALKDLFETAGVRTTAGSKFFADYIPQHNAQVVEKLIEGGAIILGKTNLHEIALGVTNINPHYGTCRNPWDDRRIPGGSSGGSAVAVSTGMCLGALGTDTGGSIRIPASLCGIVGLKPTRGRVSLRGVLPLSWNLDHVGPMTRTVRDAAVLFQIIAGHDPEDPYSIDEPVPDYLHDIDDGVQDWRVAIAVGAYVEESDIKVLDSLRQSGRIFKKLGARIYEQEIPSLYLAAQANGQIVQADGATFHRERLASAPHDFGSDVLRRLEIGAALSSTDYILARQTQSKISHWFGNFFKEFDILILPTTPIPAPLIDGVDAVEQARRLTGFTAPFNLTGLPALSLPCGFTNHGLPIGLQIVAGSWRDASVLRAGVAFEKEISG